MKQIIFSTAVLFTLLASLPTTRHAAQTHIAIPSVPLLSAQSVSTLSETGPQLPPAFDSNNFAMLFIVKGKWPLVVRYELMKGSAELRLKPLSRGVPLITKLEPTYGKKVGNVSIATPADFGDTPQVAELQIISGGQSELVLHAIACGGGALANAEKKRARPNGEQQNHRRLFSIPAFTQSLSSDEVAISGISLVPQDILDASKGANLSFSFTSANDFPMWSATFQRQVQTSGSRWQVERILPFNTDPINQGQKKQTLWDGKNEKGKVVGGRYKLMLSAWTSAASDGSALTSFSSPAITVR